MTPLRVVRRVPNVKMLLVRDRNFEICNAAASTEFLGLLDFMTAEIVLKLFPSAQLSSMGEGLSRNF